MKKVVLKLDLPDERTRTKALQAVSGLSGVESVSVDMDGQKLTLIGDTDPVRVVSKLKKKKLCHAHILSVGPPKEEKPASKPEKPEGTDEEEKLAKLSKEAWENYYKYLMTQSYPYSYPYRPVVDLVVEETPNSCAIL